MKKLVLIVLLLALPCLAQDVPYPRPGGGGSSIPGLTSDGSQGIAVTGKTAANGFDDTSLQRYVVDKSLCGTDGTTSINALKAKILAAGGGAMVFPPCETRYNGTFTPPDVPFAMLGVTQTRRFTNTGQAASRFKCTQTTSTDCISLAGRTSTNYFGIDSLEIIGNSSQANCFNSGGFSGGSMRLSNTQVEACGGNGFNFSVLYDATFSNLQALNVVGDGFFCGNCNNNTLAGVSEFTGSGGNGVHFNTGVSNTFLGIDVSANAGCGILFDGSTSAETSKNIITGYWESGTGQPNRSPVCLGQYTYNNDLRNFWISQGESVVDSGVGNLYSLGQGGSAPNSRDVGYTNLATNSSFASATVSGSQGVAGTNGFGTVTSTFAQDTTAGVATANSAKLTVTSVTGSDQTLNITEATSVAVTAGDVWMYRFKMKANRTIKSFQGGAGLEGMKVYFSAAANSVLPSNFIFPYIDTNWRDVCLVGQFTTTQSMNVIVSNIGVQNGDIVWITDRTLAKVPSAAYVRGNPCENLPYVQTALVSVTTNPGVATQDLHDITDDGTLVYVPTNVGWGFNSGVFSWRESASIIAFGSSTPFSTSATLHASNFLNNAKTTQLSATGLQVGTGVSVNFMNSTDMTGSADAYLSRPAANTVCVGTAQNNCSGIFQAKEVDMIGVGGGIATVTEGATGTSATGACKVTANATTHLLQWSCNAGTVYLVKPTSNISFLVSPGGFAWNSPIPPATTTELLGGTSFRINKDLTGVTEFRITAGVTIAGATGCKLALQFSTDGGTTWNYLDSGTGTVGTQPVAIDGSVSPSSPKAGAWTTMATSARGDYLIRVVENGGDGTTAPTLRYVQAEFR